MKVFPESFRSYLSIIFVAILFSSCVSLHKDPFSIEIDENQVPESFSANSGIIPYLRDKKLEKEKAETKVGFNAKSYDLNHIRLDLT